jgi:hypothetical protein
MALILIKDSDYTHLDPVKDQRGAYKRGDLVVVYPDWQHGHCTGGHAGTHPATPAEQRQSIDCQALGVWVSDAADLTTDPIAAPFYLIRVSGLTLAEAGAYILPDTEPDTPDDDGRPRVKTVTRRLHRLRVDDLPGPIQAQLDATRYYAVAWTGGAGVGRFVRNKRTGQDAVP